MIDLHDLAKYKDRQLDNQTLTRLIYHHFNNRISFNLGSSSNVQFNVSSIYHLFEIEAFIEKLRLRFEVFDLTNDVELPMNKHYPLDQWWFVGEEEMQYVRWIGILKQQELTI